MRRTAACRCGACTIEVQGEPVANLICHCASCRRRTGGPCSWTATFREDQVVAITGQFVTYRSTGSAGRVDNSFCSACGTTLFFRPLDFAGIIGCAGGCFVDPPLAEPAVSANDDLRFPWLHLPESWQVRVSIEAGGRHLPPAGEDK